MFIFLSLTQGRGTSYLGDFQVVGEREGHARNGPLSVEVNTY